MIAYTDSLDYARTVTLDSDARWSPLAVPSDDGVRILLDRVYGGKEVLQCHTLSNPSWNCLLLVEEAERSNYDLLIELAREKVELPHCTLLLAGAGSGFHGFNDRIWSAPPGNTYLSVYYRPATPVPHPATAFTVLATVSVVEAIDALAGLKNAAGIKWVNDILIDEAKVGGVLAYTQSSRGVTGVAVLGIGVNVETEPEVAPTPFVPRAGSLKALSPRPEDCTQRRLFATLTESLAANYRELTAGQYTGLLDRYRMRSLALGREVTICADRTGTKLEAIATGRVLELGDNLELTLEGYTQPFTKGRLMFEPAAPPAAK
jgi:BirA family biotin operon repressor/biotin-[acetyl-CoA-carboxylase] ligase